MTTIPDARDDGIAELRARRRARMRMLAVRSAISTLGVLLLAVVALYWLLTTVAGRDVLLAQIVSRLPAGTTLTWASAQGPASGPLTLRNVRFITPTHASDCVADALAACPITGHLTFFADTIVLDPALRPLLGRRLRLDALDVTDATLDLPKSDKPFELPRWPEVLPEIAPPLSLQADAIRIDRFKIVQAGEALIDVRQLRGGIDASTGRLHVERMRIDSDRGRFALHGDYAPKDDYRTDLTASALLPAPAGRTAPRLGLVARGDLSRMDVVLAGNAPAPMHANLSLRAPSQDAKDAPRWTLRAQSTALDIGLLTNSDKSSEPLAFDLHADGTGGVARLQGKASQGTFAVDILPSNVRLNEQVLDVQPLTLRIFDGTAMLRGHADFRDPQARKFRMAIVARGLRWGGDTAAAPAPVSQVAAPLISADADVGIAGTLESWTAIGKATLARDGKTAVLAIDGRGNNTGMTLKSLRATMPTGRLDGSGTVAWSPTLDWNIDATLAGFDPGYFAPQWPGAINGKLATQGRTRADGGLDLVVDATRLGGRLRTRPLQGRGHLLMRGASLSDGDADYEGDIALTLGGSRIDAKGKIAKAIAVDATLSPLQLNDLLPNAAGTLRGSLTISGTRAAPNIAADLAGSGLRWGDYRADALSAKGRLPWKGSDGALTVTASHLQAGIAIDTLHLQANGAVEALRLEGTARSGPNALDFAATADKRGPNWQGTLQSLQAAPGKGAAWHLQSPAHYAQVISKTGTRWTLSQSCFASSGGGSLCASADWPRRLDVHGSGLPLTLATPYLPEREDGRPWLLRGEIAVDAQVRPVGNSWHGNARIASPGGGLKLNERARHDVVAYDRLSLEATFDPHRIEANLSAALNGDGHLAARIASGWDAYAPLSGEVSLDTDELTWMELLSPDIVEPTGSLSGRITLAGTRAQPALGGQAQLTQFATELPALAIALQDG
ncbi:MAG: translocation/assembly module TamB, partial [Luteimonas sp.]